MTGKGKRLYVCQDCKEVSAFHWTSFERAARVRCPSCGSTWLEPKTEQTVAENDQKLGYRKEKENATTTVDVRKKNARGQFYTKGIKW